MNLNNGLLEKEIIGWNENDQLRLLNLINYESTALNLDNAVFSKEYISALEHLNILTSDGKLNEKGKQSLVILQNMYGSNTIPCNIDGCDGKMSYVIETWEENGGSFQQRSWECYKCSHIVNNLIITKANS